MQFQIGDKMRLNNDQSVPIEWRGIAVTVVDTVTTTMETKNDLLAEASASGPGFIGVVVKRDDGQRISVDIGDLKEL